uniref:Ubiquitin hydrolase n=1 Tax=Tanacetum cinerariifolium TaxID=118510 RepID=A0A6L2JIB9_TANCI|nr:ubiquitin hydrolase [Tanacetum cinerariifolium]
MAKSSSENEPCRLKDCKKNNDNQNSKIKDLTGYNAIPPPTADLYLSPKKYLSWTGLPEFADNTVTDYSRPVPNVERYNAIPPPAADLYLSPKKYLSWTGLPEFADNTVTDYSRPVPNVESTSEDGQNRISFASENGEPTDSILSKPAVIFVKAIDRPAKRPTTNKAETVKKPPVKYAEMYRRPSKKPTVRGNQQNWNNMKTQQLGPDFVMKKKACFNCGDFNHLAYDCRKRVKRGTTGSQNNAYMRPPHRPDGHRPHGPPMKPMRPNMNGTRPNKTNFNKQAHSYANRSFQRTSAVRPQYKAPRVPTVNKNFPPVNRKLPTGNSNVPLFVADAQDMLIRLDQRQ